MTRADDKQHAHRKHMRKLRAEVRAKTAALRPAGRGLVLVHTGDGKGKSSSAFGVVVRSLGWGHRVGVIQFIKGDWKTGEQQFFRRFPDQVDWRTMGEGFTWDTQDRARDIRVAERAFAAARDMLESGSHDLVVLDEINVVTHHGYLECDALLEALEARAQRTSVILTGRDAAPEVVDYADLVTGMKEVKHPFAAGIRARRGIDY